MDGKKNIFAHAKENSIEVYDDKFSRNSILTRSARIRKFKFYQYKPIQETPNNASTPKASNSSLLKHKSNSEDISNHSSKALIEEPSVLLPRDEILQGRVSTIYGTEQSKEFNELDDQIVELERKIADLNSNGNTGDNKLGEIFELVNKKNDLLRRQMQLNILEQERNLEKANEELTKELRLLLSIDDSKKTKSELERQQYLYDQLLALVDKRNELVLHMDVQEKCIDDDNALKANLKQVISNSSHRNKVYGQDQSCCIQ